MHYLANYYKNLSEQLQEKVNFLEKQLNEYKVRPGEQYKFAAGDLLPDKAGNKINLSPLPSTPVPKYALLMRELEGIRPDPTLRPETKPASPGIPMFPERKPLIGKVPMLGDTDAIDIMPKPDMDAINVMPKPDTNTINITPQRPGYNINKPKIKRFGDSGPKLPLAPIKPQGSQNQNTATNIDFRNYEPIKLIQNERGKFKG
jgi:hypothetical protein